MTVLYKFRNEGYFIFTQQKIWKYEERSYELPGDGPEYFGLIESADGTSSDFVQYLKNLETVLYIVDLHTDSHNESLTGAFTIILSSCDKEKYASALTSSTKTLSVLWMPTWTKEIKDCFPAIDKLEERFNSHGGVLRYLLWPESQARKDLNSTRPLQRLLLQLLIQIARMPNSAGVWCTILLWKGTTWGLEHALHQRK